MLNPEFDNFDGEQYKEYKRQKLLELLKSLEMKGHPDIYLCPCCQGGPNKRTPRNFFEEEPITINHYDDCELAKALVSEQSEEELKE